MADEPVKPKEEPGSRKRQILERLGRKKPEAIPEPGRKSQILERLGSEREKRVNTENSKALIANAITRAAEIMKKRDIFLKDQKDVKDSNYPGNKFLQSEINRLGEQLQLIFAELTRLGVDRGEALQAIKMKFDEDDARERESRPPRGPRR